LVQSVRQEPPSERKKELADAICKALKVHTTIEEISYPAFLEVTEDGGNLACGSCSAPTSPRAFRALRDEGTSGPVGVAGAGACDGRTRPRP